MAFPGALPRRRRLARRVCVLHGNQPHFLRGLHASMRAAQVHTHCPSPGSRSTLDLLLRHLKCPYGQLTRTTTICMSCIGSFSTALGAAGSGPNGPSLSPSSVGALAPRRATMLRSGCISKMATVPTNRTNARAEETVYPNGGTNAHVSCPLPSNLRKEPATRAAPLLLYSV